MHKDTGTGWPEPPERDDAGRPEADLASDPNPAPTEQQPPVPERTAEEFPPDSEPATEDLVTEDLVTEDPVTEEPAATGAPARRRVSVAVMAIALLLGMFGFALVVQLKSNTTDPLAAARPEDLARIWSDLQAREDRLRQEIAELEESQRQLASGAEGRQAALDEARQRADELGILAGTLPAEGRGLVVVFRPGNQPVRASAILDAVQELRGAGAEAMQIAGAGGSAVRIVASTAFVDGEGGIVTGGQRLLAPYTITVIGDPDTMRTALSIPGGVVESVTKDGGTVTVQEPGKVQVTALHRQGDLRYAQPAS